MELVMLAKDYDPAIHNIVGWLWSEKMDGCRCWWDGGASLGLTVGEVPYASKIGKLHLPATGWWSRYGKRVGVPFEGPMGTLLDTELWMGRRMFQKAVSVFRQEHWTRAEWIATGAKMRVIDAPRPYSMFSPRTVREHGTKKHEFLNININGPKWWFDRVKDPISGPPSFVERYEWLQSKYLGDYVEMIEQSRFVRGMSLDNLLDDLCAQGAEGLMFRAPGSDWIPQRVSSLLKVKPILFVDGVVVGTTEGKGKHTGVIGALVVESVLNAKTVRYECGGLTDEQRRAVDWIGTKVTVKYKELTDSGLPREPRV